MTDLCPAKPCLKIEEALQKGNHHLLPAERCRTDRPVADGENT